MTADRPLWKIFIAFLGPMMLANILQSLSGTLNSIFLGQMIGVSALAAASAFFPVMFFLIAFLIGMGTGASVLIGQAWGAKQPDKVRAIVGTATSVTLIAGLVVAVVGGTFAGSLMKLLGTPPDVLAEATAYGRITLIGMPLLFLFFLVTSMMRGVGDTVTPLKALAVSTATGLLVTPALIRGWLGLPKLGAASAAVATVFAITVALGWLAFDLRRRRHVLAPDRELIQHLRVDRTLLRAVLRIGLPTGMQMIAMSLAELVLLGLVNGFGSNATAAYGAVNQVLSYVQFPALSIAITASILGAQAIGAGRSEQLGAIARTGLLLNLVITGTLIVLAYALSRPLLGLFITDPAVIELAQRLVHIVMWSVVIFGMASVLSGVMRASGTVLIPTGIAISVIALVEVPSAWLLSQKIGIDGVWAAYPIAFTSMFVLQATYYRLGWRRKTITRLAF
ncbi:MATE family efflux transporter [Vulgatibacter incomptus]|uniref:Multi antimicrobial extrusion protein n=1 Tax=Vulgatibacter incomptus TaxID=1391653 RepID=A0A0K1PB97_9BACT|nr:MATE family efflux transporter [Vulgatibacter incomptus]AKU90795.1 Multi antimicrobial extrusion protein [Vulgatibacter incomptus]